MFSGVCSSSCLIGRMLSFVARKVDDEGMLRRGFIHGARADAGDCLGSGCRVWLLGFIGVNGRGLYSIAACGRISRIVLPTPKVLSASIEPPKSCAIPRAIVSPSPPPP